MDWIVRIRDQKDNRECERHYDTEPNFMNGVKELREKRWQRIVSATLPSGIVLDEEKLRRLISPGSVGTENPPVKLAREARKS